MLADTGKVESLDVILARVTDDGVVTRPACLLAVACYAWKRLAPEWVHGSNRAGSMQIPCARGASALYYPQQALSRLDVATHPNVLRMI